MTRTMQDSVTVSALQPGQDLYAGYVDGRYANIDQVRQRFPHALIVSITVTGNTLNAHVADVETGDLTPKSGASWAQRRKAAGYHPTLYCNTSTRPAVEAECRKLGLVLGRDVWIWEAHYDNIATLPANTVAKQYIDHGPHGENIDLSVVADRWPGVDPPPPLTLPWWYHRPLREGMSGADVLACKHRMWRLGYHALKFTPAFGSGLASAVRTLQHHAGLPGTGVIDDRTAHAIRVA